MADWIPNQDQGTSGSIVTGEKRAGERAEFHVESPERRWRVVDGDGTG